MLDKLLLNTGQLWISDFAPGAQLLASNSVALHPVANKFEIYDGAQVDIAYVTRHMAHYVKT